VIKCKNGVAEAVKGDPDQTYKCKAIVSSSAPLTAQTISSSLTLMPFMQDMYDFKTHLELGSNGGEGSGSWGWSHKGREFIAIGQTDGTSFSEVSKKGQLVYLGRLPAQADPVIWREIRVNGDYLVVGSEGTGHGVQIFDMRKLLTVNPKQPVTFSTTSDLTSLFNGEWIETQQSC
jgi:hypothetical protein